MAAMLQDTTQATPDASCADADESVLVSRDLFERMQGEIKFNQTKIDALNLEIARLKRWRFGSSSESLEASTQAVLFDAILADTLLEDIAAQQEIKAAPAAPRAKGQAVRQALPASLPRIERHHELEQTHCACGQAFKRIGEEVSEQLDCVPNSIGSGLAFAFYQPITAFGLPAQRSIAAITRLTRDSDSPAACARVVIVMPCSR